MKPEQAVRILEYLDRCPLGIPGSAGMHAERLEMNQLTDVLVGIANAIEPEPVPSGSPDEPPPESQQPLDEEKQNE